ncbi:hypothetical protein Celaphus_00017609 [Cervus elaphus hippelaphus]|uniref:Uncharacterized protein n=1 Tax=Cervus elaphus hippelaphus TaxID=46360 RepID=A0A212C6N3_CEREH|nr:hypothetical protein Celaphus_00017609 [Cervus elaphus hippelaphus]
MEQRRQQQQQARRKMAGWLPACVAHGVSWLELPVTAQPGVQGCSGAKPAPERPQRRGQEGYPGGAARPPRGGSALVCMPSERHSRRPTWKRKRGRCPPAGLPTTRRETSGYNTGPGRCSDPSCLVLQPEGRRSAAEPAPRPRGTRQREGSILTLQRKS